MKQITYREGCAFLSIHRLDLGAKESEETMHVESKNWIWLKCSLMALLTNDLTWRRHNAYELFRWLVKKAIQRWINCHFDNSSVFRMRAYHTRRTTMNGWNAVNSERTLEWHVNEGARGVRTRDEDNRWTIDKWIDACWRVCRTHLFDFIAIYNRFMRQSNKVSATIHTRFNPFIRLDCTPRGETSCVATKCEYVSHKKHGLTMPLNHANNPWFCELCSRHLIAPINLLRARFNCMQLFDLILAIRLCQSIECFIG